MLRIITDAGCFEIENPALEEQMADKLVAQQKEADSLQQALSVVYRIGGEPDPSRPWNGLLTERLDISTDAAYQLIRSGQLAFFCAGKKNYRVTEQHVREFTGQLKQAS